MRTLKECADKIKAVEERMALMKSRVQMEGELAPDDREDTEALTGFARGIAWVVGIEEFDVDDPCERVKGSKPR